MTLPTVYLNDDTMSHRKKIYHISKPLNSINTTHCIYMSKFPGDNSLNLHHFPGLFLQHIAFFLLFAKMDVFRLGFLSVSPVWSPTVLDVFRVRE